MTPPVFVLAALTVWRCAHLLAHDTITEPLRYWIAPRSEWLASLIECPLCSSAWLAAATATFLGATGEMAWHLWPVVVGGLWAVASLISVAVDGR